MSQLKRIQPGRYEDGTYGVRKIGPGHWETFRLADEENLDGGWMQSYGRLCDAKAGLAELYSLHTRVQIALANRNSV